MLLYHHHLGGLLPSTDSCDNETRIIVEAGCSATVLAREQPIPRVLGQGFTGSSNLLLFELPVRILHLVRFEIFLSLEGDEVLIDSRGHFDITSEQICGSAEGEGMIEKQIFVM